MAERYTIPESDPGGFSISSESARGWVAVDRDEHTGEVRVRVRPGSLRGRGEAEVAEEIRSGLLAAARAYTARHREELRRTYGELPDEIRDWGQR